jgi:NACalpha-BTF3-like transcription factor
LVIRCELVSGKRADTGCLQIREGFIVDEDEEEDGEDDEGPRERRKKKKRRRAEREEEEQLDEEDLDLIGESTGWERKAAPQQVRWARQTIRYCDVRCISADS